jgi:hypothetical protein
LIVSFLGAAAGGTFSFSSGVTIRAAAFLPFVGVMFGAQLSCRDSRQAILKEGMRRWALMVLMSLA